jgi:iron complex outermembrane receptor protein
MPPMRVGFGLDPSDSARGTEFRPVLILRPEIVDKSNVRTIVTLRSICLAAFIPLAVRGQAGLADASLEQLLNTQVTSVSKKEQKLARAAAAVFVIGPDEIRRSGAASLADVLRMVPGVDVAQIDANAWAITIRGFNSRYSSKLLVLIDGRSVYTPSFSGVFWDHLDLPLEDVERIEVIRGPGATVWGANAMNGVINIITKSSKATKGGLAAVTAGSGIQPVSVLRYGNTMGSSGAYRTFAKYSRFTDTTLQDGAAAADGWSRVHGGFRGDWALAPRDSATVEGDLFSNRGGQTRNHWFQRVPFDQPFTEAITSAGGHLMAEWNHTAAGGSETSVRGYFDTYRRNDVGTVETMKTLDLDFQSRFAAGSRHDIVWGAGFRTVRSGVLTSHQIQLSPPFRTDRLYNVFFQDEIALTGNLWLTAGSKIEHNADTGFEYEPSVRMAWAPSARHTVWVAGSRAIRQPSRQETGLAVEVAEVPLDANTLMAVRLFGSPRFRSEELRDFEIGYRAEWTRHLSFDADLFLSSYRHLASIETQPQVVHTQGFPIRIEVPTVYGNLGRATSYGGESSLTWAAGSRWRLAPGYSWQHANPGLEPGSNDRRSRQLALDSPQHTFQIRSLLDVARGLEWGQTLYWTARRPQGSAPSHARLDTRLAWRLGERTEISLVGQNLLRPRFLEFNDTSQIVAAQAQRSVFGKITWAF